MIEKKEYLTTQDLAQKGVVSRSQVVYDIRVGNLPAIKLGNVYVVSSEEAEKYIERKLRKRARRGKDITVQQ